jgi:hypothetical protein
LTGFVVTKIVDSKKADGYNGRITSKTLTIDSMLNDKNIPYAKVSRACFTIMTPYGLKTSNYDGSAAQVASEKYNLGDSVTCYEKKDETMNATYILLSPIEK